MGIFRMIKIKFRMDVIGELSCGPRRQKMSKRKQVMRRERNCMPKRGNAKSALEWRRAKNKVSSDSQLVMVYWTPASPMLRCQIERREGCIPIWDCRKRPPKRETIQRDIYLDHDLWSGKGDVCARLTAPILDRREAS